MLHLIEFGEARIVPVPLYAALIENLYKAPFLALSLPLNSTMKECFRRSHRGTSATALMCLPPPLQVYSKEMGAESK